MSHDEFDDVLRDAFRRRREALARQAPAFTASAPTTLQRTPRASRWLVPMAATALLAVALWWSVEEPAPPAAPGPELLLAELTSTTYWRAPSDRWLGAVPDPAWQGLPELPNPTPRPGRLP